MAWVDQHQAYLAACRRIALELRTAPERSTFKQDQDYAAVIGNDTRGRAATTAFLQHLRGQYKDKHIAARVAANDRYGSPVKSSIDGRRWSAGSLRFLQVADEIGEAAAVIEIGGGYGGQRLLCEEIADYTIVDLPDAIDVQRAYLDLHGVLTTFVEAGQPVEVKPGTFLLSDFALSELESELIDNYIETLVSLCERGRLTCGASARDGMVTRLVRHFKTVDVEPERPATSRHANVVIRFEGPAVLSSVTVMGEADTAHLMSERLRSSQPWAFSRWGDGEWSAILGKGTQNCDGQAYEPLREPLRQVLRDTQSYLLGMQPLAMQRFGDEIAGWLEANDLSLPWVNADVFHDLSKAGALIEFVAPLRDRDVIVVGPEYLRAVSSILPYVSFVDVPERNAYDVLDDIRQRLWQELAERAWSKRGVAVAFSAGMSANILIDKFVCTPNTLIDFGSVWDPYVGHVTRRYHADIVAREGTA